MGKTMGKYCKAYPLTRLRAYPEWSEMTENVRVERKVVDGREVEVERELTEQDFLYLQENYLVTDGIFLDENVIFDDVTPEWIEFCQNVLAFEIPNFEMAAAREETQPSDNGKQSATS